MNLKKIVCDNLCIGCGMCVAMYPSKLNLNTKGFFNYPSIVKKLNRNEVASIKKICPGLNQGISDALVEGYTNHKIWGSFLDFSLCFSSNVDYRYIGSSAGVISQLAIYLIESKKVDGVIHIDKTGCNPWDYSSTISFTRADVLRKIGSKYLPVSPLVGLLDLVKSGGANKKYAIIARPCDITAIKNFEQLNPEIKNSISLLISFFCAGTPSRKAIYELAKYFELDIKDITEIKFRGNGCPGNTVFSTTNTTRSTTYAHSWGEYLGPSIHKRCKICMDGIGLNADIVFGDYWKISESGYPILSETDGREFVFLRTNKAKYVFDEMLKEDLIKLEEGNMDNLELIQQSHYYKYISMLPRILAKLILFNEVPKYRGRNLIRLSLELGVFRFLKVFFGAVYRVLIGRL